MPEDLPVVRAIVFIVPPVCLLLCFGRMPTSRTALTSCSWRRLEMNIGPTVTTGVTFDVDACRGTLASARRSSSPFDSRAKWPASSRWILQRLQVALVRLGPGGREDLIVLAPGDQHRRLVLAEILLPLRIQRRVAAVAEEQVELDLVVALAVKQELVVGRPVRADQFGILYAVRVLPLGRFVGERGCGWRRASPCSLAPSSTP